MKKIVLSVLLLSNLISFAQTTKNVYFIGNSYTGTNNLPLLIQQVAASTQDVLTYQEHTPGGSTLQQHATNPTVTNTINLGTWDYVVLQQQSQMPAFPNANATLNAATQLSAQIRNANPCATPLFYMTWGYKNGDAVNCANGITYMCTYQGMDDKIYDRYMQMTEDNDAVVSPVGRVWKAIRAQYPNYELYSADESHPSLLGSMAAAYTFYTVIYKKDPTLVTFNSSLDATTAQNIKNIVKTVVFDELEDWKVGINDVPSKFTYQLQVGNTIQFTNQSEGASTFLWNFGDGTTSILENPTHTYATNQTYTVTLTTNACGMESTQTKVITIENLSNDAVWKNEVNIFPNPASDIINITNLNFNTIEVFDVTGRRVLVKPNIQDDLISINVQTLTKGSYIIKLSKDQKTHHFSFVKK